MASDCPQVTPGNAQRPLFAGVDLGGTGIKIGVVDDRGQTIGATRISTDQERGPEDGIQPVLFLFKRNVERAFRDRDEMISATRAAIMGNFADALGLELN